MLELLAQIGSDVELPHTRGFPGNLSLKDNDRRSAVLAPWIGHGYNPLRPRAWGTGMGGKIQESGFLSGPSQGSPKPSLSTSGPESSLSPLG